MRSTDSSLSIKFTHHFLIFLVYNYVRATSLLEPIRIKIVIHSQIFAVNKVTISKGGKKGSGKNYIMRSLMICAAHPILRDKIEKNGIGGASSAYGGR